MPFLETGPGPVLLLLLHLWQLETRGYGPVGREQGGIAGIAKGCSLECGKKGAGGGMLYYDSIPLLLIGG